MPEREDSTALLALHRRLLDGDRIASEELISLLLSPLTDRLAGQFPRVDRQIISDGVVDALLEYCAEADRFDEQRNVPLDRFLSKAAWRNIANSLRGEKRRKVREEKASVAYGDPLVELDPTAGNLLQKEETARRRRQEVVVMQMLPDLQDREIWTLRIQGERRTEAFADILGIAHLPAAEQRREVKRAKDRIDKVVRRHKGDEE